MTIRGDGLRVQRRVKVITSFSSKSRRSRTGFLSGDRHILMGERLNVRSVRVGRDISSALLEESLQCCDTQSQDSASETSEYRRAWRYRAMVSMLALLAIVSPWPESGAIRRVLTILTTTPAAFLRGQSKVEVRSFVFMGCNRILWSDESPENPSTANLAQLERSFTEIAALKPRPKVLSSSPVIWWSDLRPT